MGVYIKGMKMPKSCEECTLESYCSLWMDARKLSDDGKKAKIKHPDCPLIEISTPHGDLIDRGKVNLTDFEIVMCNGDYKEGLKMLLEKIESAPTIIPAEEE